jgi:hypothetical protein
MESRHDHTNVLRACTGSIDSPEPEKGQEAQRAHDRVKGDATANYAFPDGPKDQLPGERVVPSEHGWLINHGMLSTADQVRQMDGMLESMADCFASSIADLPGCKPEMGVFEINPPGIAMDPTLSSIQAVKQKSPMEKEVMLAKLQPLKAAGIIVQCACSQFSSDVAVSARKDLATGEWVDARVCIDLRAINRLTEVYRYNLQSPESLHADLESSKWFSVIDLSQGILQCPLLEAVQDMTAFRVGEELWKYTRAPFGLRNLPSHYQHMMDVAIQRAGLQEFCKCYKDGVLVHSPTFAKHLRQIRATLLMIKDSGLRAFP